MMSAPSPSVEMAGGLVSRGEVTGRLDDDVDIELLPGQVLHLGFSEESDRVVVDRHRRAVNDDLARETAVDGVAGEQVSQIRRVGQIVHGDDLHADVGGVIEGASSALRPVLPKPLIATRTVMMELLFDRFCDPLASSLCLGSRDR